MTNELAIGLYQVGNTSSRKNTEVKQLGRVTIHGLEVDAVAKTTVKSQKPRNEASNTYMLLGPK